jgi:hypothetical protein
MKTAMQELIEELERVKSMTNMNFVIKVATDLLEKEKEQIADAFIECWKANMPDGYECKLSAKEYYNQTYNQETKEI